MSLVELILELKNAQVDLSVQQGKLICEFPKGGLSESLKQKLITHKDEIKDYISASNNVSLSKPITARKRGNNSLPLSFSQQRLWFIEQLQGSSAHYNMPSALQVKGEFIHAYAEQALQQIVARHEILRTIYQSVDSEAEQFIQPSTAFILSEVDLTQLSETEQQQEVQRLAAEDAIKPFDLSHDLMLRASWINQNNTSGQGVLLFNMHHIASDGWSIGILMEEFVQHYQSLVTNQPVSLPPLTIQYADYALWQREHIQGEVLDKQLGYWTEQLADVPVVHNLPLDFERPLQPEYQGGSVSAALSSEATEKVLALSSQHNVTSFMFLHAVLSLLLSRYSNNEDIVIGTPVANRSQKEVEPLIGFFVNTLVLRSNSEGKETFIDYLQHIKQVNLEAQTHQDIPFEQLVEHLKVPRSIQYNPIFQIIFSMNPHGQETSELEGVSFTPLNSEICQTKFDLELNVQVDTQSGKQGITLEWLYDKALFKPQSISRLNQHFHRLLNSVVSHPQGRLSDLEMLSEEEVHSLSTELSGALEAYPEDKLVHELFEEQAKQTPNNIALVFEDKQLTYKELSQASNQLAHYLREQGVGPDILVGICAERSLEMVIGMLGTMKAGGAYVPLDPTYPKARLDYMIQDSGIKLLLTQSPLVQQFEQENLQCIALDTMGVELASYDANSPIKAQQSASSLAYVIYTSGSTGQPKGVMIEQIALSNFLHAMLGRLSHVFNNQTRLLAVTTISFDISGLELLGGLVSGSKVVLTSIEDNIDPVRLSGLIEQHDITLMQATPATWKLLANHQWPGKQDLTALSGGEALPESVAHYLLPRCHQLWNCYGPTEATIWSLVKRVEENSDTQQLLSLGESLSNYQHIVLNKHQQIVPVGVQGELYIGGISLARGYLNQPALTAEKFIDNPFGQGKLYKTGDIVRYLPDGHLTFVNRIDDQVKIRGFRIELGEIEHQLSQCEGVISCVVLAREDLPGQKRLVAYVVSDKTNEEQTKDEQTIKQSLKDELSASLPNHMQPSAFVLLEAFPLTPNGKLDKKALPPPEGGSENAYSPPATKAEHVLVKIWARLLKYDAEKLSVTDSFFELGGDSILSIQVVSRAASEGLHFSIKDLFIAQTIRSLALICQSEWQNENSLPLQLNLQDCALEDYMQSDALLSQRNYWLSCFDMQTHRLSDVAANTFVTNPLVTKNRATNSPVNNAGLSEGTGIESVQLDVQQTTQLREAQKAYRTQTKELLLAALWLGVHRWSGIKSLRLDLQGDSGELLSEDMDTRQTVGHFTSIYPMTLSLEETSMTDIICAVKEQSRAVPDEGVGFGVFKYLKEDDDFQILPSRELVFNYREQVEDGQQAVSYPLSFNGVMNNGALGFALNFDKSVYYEPAMQALMTAISGALQDIVQHCVTVKIGQYTPSDFPLAQVNQAQLNQWQSDKREIEDLYPATGMQQGLLFYSMLEAGGYVSQTALKLTGLNVAHFQKAWQHVGERHAIFRTTFVGLDEGTPHQLVNTAMELPWQIKDLSTLTKAQQLKEIEAIGLSDKTAGFNLSRPPLMRMSLIYLGDDTHQFIWSRHHALLDGWCIPLLFDEVVECYSAFQTSTLPALNTPPLYRNYVAWLAKQNKAQLQDFWRSQLKGIKEATPLPLEQKSDVDEKTMNVFQHHLTFSETDTAELIQFARTTRTTVNVLIQAAWALILSRYSHETQVVFGALTSGRPAQLPQVEKMVGLFINSLPVVVDIESRKTVAEYLQQIHQQMVERETYGHLPLNEILKLSPLKNDLFDSLLVFENFPINEAVEKDVIQANLEVKDVETFEETNYGISIQVHLSNTLSITLKGQRQRFSERAIAQIAKHLNHVLHQYVNNDQALVGQVEMLPQNEINYLIHELNETQCHFPQNDSLHELFEQQATQKPDDIALVFADKQLTYQQLNEQANQLAQYLVSQGNQEGDRIGLCLGRSFDMVISILAILKIGAVYVPIEPDQPGSRINFIIEDAQLKSLITQLSITKSAITKSALSKSLAGCKLIVLDDENVNQQIAISNAQNRPHPLSSNDPHRPVYIIYTSGSTGQPKGVLVKNSGVVNFLFSFKQQLDSLGQASDAPWLWNASFAFDASVKGLVALSSGRKVVIATQEQSRDPVGIVDLLRQHKVSVFNSMPMMVEQVVDVLVEQQDLPMNLISSGEDIPERIWKKVGAYCQSAGTRAINAYGPTETTVNACYGYIELNQPVNMGKALANTLCYVLDQNLKPVPLGAKGELYIGGACLSAGYLNREELNEQSFIPNPFDANKSEKLYKTGDRVKRLINGDLVFLGRKDEQIKRRGYRIELGEIESNILKLDTIKHAIVVMGDKPTGGKQLIAYYVVQSGASVDEGELHETIANNLPDYMLPDTYISLPQLPVTSSGKIDKNALPSPQLPENLTDYQGPRNEIEKVLCEIWSQTLNIEQVSIHDDFFNLGGDSILSMQVVAKAKRKNIFISIRDIYVAKNIAKLAEISKRQKRRERRSKKVIQGSQILLPIQQQLFAESEQEPHYFNQSVLLSVPASLNKRWLSQLVYALYQRHDVFRLRFDQDHDKGQNQDQQGPWQAEYGTLDRTMLDNSVVYFDVSAEPDAVKEATILEIGQKYQSSFSLSDGGLFKVIYFDFGDESEGRLLLLAHHLVIDGVSWRIVLGDLQQGFTQLTQGEKVSLLPGTESYQDWASFLRTYANCTEFQNEAAYWLEQAQIPVTELPVKESASEQLSGAQERQGLTFSLDEEKTAYLLSSAPQVYQTEINELLLSALFMAIKKWTKSAQCRVTMEGHGREYLTDSPDVSETVGWFTTKYPFTMATTAENIADIIKSVKAQYRAIPNKGIGYGLLTYFDNDQQSEQQVSGVIPQTKSQLLFNYLGNFETSFDKSTGFAVANEAYGSNVSQQHKPKHGLTLEGVVWEDKLSVNLNYCPHRFDKGDIAQFGEDFLLAVKNIIAHCKAMNSNPDLYKTIAESLDSNTSNHIILPLNDSNSKTNVFCAPSVTGTSLSYKSLAMHLQSSLSLYGLELPDLHTDIKTYSIEGLAAFYISLIRRIQPKGPYALLGWSAGGSIMYEIACQLRSNNEEVNFLALLDQPYKQSEEYIARHRANPYEKIKDYYGSELNADWDNLAAQPQDEAIEYLANQAFSQGLTPEGMDFEMLKIHFTALVLVPQLLIKFQPKSSDLSIDLFRVNTPQDSLHNSFQYNPEETLNLDWDKATSGPINVIAAEGEHLDMVLEPHVENLARQILEQMRRKSLIN